MSTTSTDRTSRIGDIAIKAPVVAASTAALTLSGTQTVDGVALVTGDRVLVKNQSSSIDNGIYVVDTGDWSRSTDCDGSYDLANGTLVKVNSGTVGSGFWYAAGTNPIIVGTSAQTWGQASTVLAVVSAFMQTMLDDATAAAARATLGSTTVGDALFIAASSAAARTALELVPGANGTVPMARSSASTGTAYVSALGKAIYGLTYANNGSDAVNDIDIAAGGCMDSTNAFWITCAAMTKRLDANWAAGTNQGMRNSGAAITNTGYYLWAVSTDTGTQDYYAHTSTTVATVLAALQAEPGGSSYAYARLIGWINRVGGTIVAFTTYETEGGGLEHLWTAPTLDVDLANTLTTAQRLDAVKVPLNISTIALINATWYDAGAIARVWIYCPDQTGAVPSFTAAPLASGLANTSNDFNVQMAVRTNSSGQIAAYSSVATTDVYRVVTLGFRWARR